MDAKLVSALIATPTFPLNPFVGQVWLNWIWNGSVWVCQGQSAFQTVRKFTASGVYVPSVGVTYAVVECIGGGGAGGNATGLGNVFLSAGGGGSGGYSKSVIPNSLLSPSIPVTIAGYGTTGAPGGATSFGALCVANGGGPGGNAGGSAFGLGGQRALPGVGDLALPGAAGENGAYGVGGNILVATGGLGGAIIGGNPYPTTITGSLVNGATGDANTGAGGGGACSSTAPSGTAFGGQGASGLCIVTEFGLGPTALADLTPPVSVEECDENGNPVGAKDAD